MKERLIGVEVADPGEDGLIEQGDFDGPACRREGGSEPVGPDRQGIRPEREPVFETEGVRIGERCEASEPAWIAEAQASGGTVVGGEGPERVRVGRLGAG